MIKEKSRIKETVVALITHEDGTKEIVGQKPKSFNVIGILRDKFGKIKKIIKAENEITNDGDIWFAQLAASETPTNDFVNLVLGSGSIAVAKDDDYDDVTPIANTNKAPTATYPKSNDDDEDNTGKAIDSITWKYEYTKADFNSTIIREGCITIVTPIAGSKVLTRWVWPAIFEKTATDTLTVFVNENCLGV